MTETRSLYLIRCTYGADAHSLRERAMAEHLSYLQENGHRLRFAGPLLADDGRTATGSNAIVEVSDRTDAEDFIAEEAFNRAGMFDDIEILRFESGLNNRQVHITPDPEREMFFCRWTTAARSGMSSAGGFEVSQGDPSVRMLEGGALLTDDATQVIGGLFILEVHNRPAAEDFLAMDIRRRSGDADDVLVSRWRFGQALGMADPTSIG